MKHLLCFAILALSVAQVCAFLCRPPFEFYKWKCVERLPVLYHRNCSELYFMDFACNLRPESHYCDVLESYPVKHQCTCEKGSVQPSTDEHGKLLACHPFAIDK